MTEEIQPTLLEELYESLRRVNRVEVSSRWYYDIGAHSFEQIKALVVQCPWLQAAVDDHLQMQHWYGPSYVVPVDRIPLENDTYVYG